MFRVTGGVLTRSEHVRCTRADAHPDVMWPAAGTQRRAEPAGARPVGRFHPRLTPRHPTSGGRDPAGFLRKAGGRARAEARCACQPGPEQRGPPGGRGRQLFLSVAGRATRPAAQTCAWPVPGAALACRRLALQPLWRRMGGSARRGAYVLHVMRRKFEFEIIS